MQPLQNPPYVAAPLHPVRFRIGCDTHTVKNAVELLDVPPRINSLMMKNYNSHVEILFSYCSAPVRQNRVTPQLV
jgi:hypothetical protein